jgi:hypothetical protein
MAKAEPARWWTIKRAHSRRPATYTCPFCRRRLHAMSEHVVIAPEGDVSKRRHAHADCVRRAELPSYDDWRKTQPRERSWWRRLRGH